MELKGDDGLHLTEVDGGAAAAYTYNALNQRVRIDIPGDYSEEFIFDPWGRHTSSYDVTDGWGWADWVYWGTSTTRVAVDVDAQEYFDHADWEGTERVRTTYNGNIDGLFDSLPFGDGYTVTGSDRDPYHFAMMDKDYYEGVDSGTDHATFRQYSETAGRWMNPDPYSGSYDFSNPQSFNRYSYVLNNPFAFTDPSGLITNNELCADNCTNSGDGGMIAAIATLGVSALIDELESIFGPSFHGSLKPRPNSQPWDEYHIHYGPDIAGAFGLPDEQCGFGVCDGGVSSLTQGQPQGQSGTLRNPFTIAYTFSGILVPFIGIGPAGTFTYIPSQHLVCIGGGVGASAGHNFSFGPVFLSAAKARKILGGASVSFGANITPLIGAQTSINTSGSSGGYSIGVPGISGAATYSGCFSVHR